MKNINFVLRILLSIRDNKICHRELNYLIETAQSYAYSYLKFRCKNLNKILLAEDVTLNELAIDAIASLFERNDEGVFVKLKTAFENWKPPIETEDRALFFLNRIVAKSVEKYISLLLRDSDPFFSKILDTVTYYIEKFGYKKKQLVGTTFILENESIIRIGCLLDSQSLNELPSELFSNIPQVLPKLFQYLKNETAYSAAIPINALVMKLKAIGLVDLNPSVSSAFSNQLSVDSIIDVALQRTFIKLRESYLNKSKLNQDEVCKIEKALKKISYDIRDGGINTCLHKYFFEQFPDVSLDKYSDEYQNIFEYLYKFLRKEIEKQIINGA